jgi:hypothetical protein
VRKQEIRLPFYCAVGMGLCRQADANAVQRRCNTPTQLRASWAVKAHCYTFQRSIRSGPVSLSHFHHQVRSHTRDKQWRAHGIPAC